MQYWYQNIRKRRERYGGGEKLGDVIDSENVIEKQRERERERGRGSQVQGKDSSLRVTLHD